MIGLDSSVFQEKTQGSNTRTRLARYLKRLRHLVPGSTLTDLILARGNQKPLGSLGGLWLIPVRAPCAQLLPLTGFLAALRLRRQLQPDIITTQDPLETGLLGLVLKWAFQAPLEVQVHFNLLSPYWLAEHRWWNRVRRWLACFVLARADAIRVVSSPLKRVLVERWGISQDQIAVIPVPVFYNDPLEATNDACLEALSTPDSKVVLFVGRLCYPKNLPGLFTVIEKVLHARPDVEFILVGDGPEYPYAAERAAALDERRIHVVGNIPYADLPHYYRHADVLVLPSLYEGFGRVVLEGYLFGTPAVATRCGGPEDIIADGETGFLTEIEDMERFADRVVWLLDHPAEARRMGERGRVQVQQEFDPDRLIERMVGEWQRLFVTARRLAPDRAAHD
jgi:glycosyltransferase involved in cell wall biosynthesis